MLHDLVHLSHIYVLSCVYACRLKAVQLLGNNLTSIDYVQFYGKPQLRTVNLGFLEGLRDLDGEELRRIARDSGDITFGFSSLHVLTCDAKLCDLRRMGTW